MPAKRIEFTVSEAELARLDRERGLVPRAAWIKARLFGGEPEPYAFEAERQAVREAVDAGATSVRVEAGSVAASRYRPKREVKPIPKADK